MNEEALRLRRAALGPDHPDTLQSLHNMASFDHDVGRIGDTIRPNEEAIKLKKARLGPDHPETIMGTGNLDTD
jgi:hypothetical protein